MRVLIFHGYLLGGTGSNVYNARLAAALVRLGHEVHLLSQDRHPERHAFVDVAGDWDGGGLRLRAVSARAQQEDPRCTVYRPNIGALLPVYVADRYEGIEARTFADCSDAEVASYIDANVAAVREVAELTRPDVALANHLVMGPVILARGLRGRVPYAAKVHGSALEYTVKPHPERFLGLAREGVAGASTILVGSRHTALSLWDALEDPAARQRTRLGPPGVDVQRFAPRGPREAAEGLRALAERLGGAARPTTQAEQTNAFARDDRAAAAALERLDPERDRLVAFVGKLIFNKGVDLLLAAWPLVLEQVPQAKLVVVGFGGDRERLERLLEALADGEIERAQIGAMRHLRAFQANLRGTERERYRAAARGLHERVVFTGRLDHEELAELLPACEALVVPSTFPEAFGMVAAEAAACGVLPISAAHSGLAEVSEVLAGAVPAPAGELLSFPVDDLAVPALAERLIGWLTADPALRSETRAGLAAVVRERWSWEGVAEGVIAAARGELGALARP
jgi:glycosyltransferase involved in cell wall biosynthesis